MNCLKMSQQEEKIMARKIHATGEAASKLSFWRVPSVIFQYGLTTAHRSTENGGCRCRRCKPYLSWRWPPFVLSTHCSLFELLSSPVLCGISHPPSSLDPPSPGSPLGRSPFSSPSNTRLSLSSAEPRSAPELRASCRLSLPGREAPLLSSLSLGSVELPRAESPGSSWGLSVWNAAELLWARDARVFSACFSSSLLNVSSSEEGRFFWEDLSKSHHRTQNILMKVARDRCHSGLTEWHLYSGFSLSADMSFGKHSSRACGQWTGGWASKDSLVCS